MTQMLVLVHGMGTSPAGWSDEPGGPKAKLNAIAKQYRAFKTGPAFCDRLVVREIAYDDCFATLVNQWQAKSTELAKFALSAQRPLPKLVDWLDRSLPMNEAAAKQFFWSTASDPLLYRGFALVRDRVRVAVMTQLVEMLKDAGSQAINVTVVAHSLGTAVMHDVLHLLGNGVLPDEVKDVEVLLPSRWKFANLFMIADVCLLGPPATRDIDPFASIVRPVMPDGSRDGYCRKFFEVWHRFDPFAILAPFRPGDWGKGYRPIGPLSHFRSANVHGFTHYLDHPAVHVPLINFALGEEAITAREEAAALGAYADIVAPECGQQIGRVKAKATEFAAVGDDLQDLVIKIAEFYALARDAGASCQGISDALGGL